MNVGATLLTVATEAINVLHALEFGSTGGVVLGDFSFDEFEVPAQVQFGGSQAMVVHRLVGGERVVDLLGPDDADIEWSGIFMNSTGVNITTLSLDAGDRDPHLRALRLDQMRAAGDPLPLVWGTNFYSVIIKSVRFDTRYGHVPYHITCVVLRNEATAPVGGGPVDTKSAVTDDLNSAATAAPDSAAPAVDAAQQTVATAAETDLPVPPIPPVEEALPVPPIPPESADRFWRFQADVDARIKAAGVTEAVAVTTPMSLVPSPAFVDNFSAGVAALP